MDSKSTEMPAEPLRSRSNHEQRQRDRRGVPGRAGSGNDRNQVKQQGRAAVLEANAKAQALCGPTSLSKAARSSRHSWFTAIPEATPFGVGEE